MQQIATAQQFVQLMSYRQQEDNKVDNKADWMSKQPTQDYDENSSSNTKCRVKT